VPGVVTPASRLALAAAALAVLAAPLAAGCSPARPAPSRATVATCYAFAVQALDRHTRVTSIPTACAGLGHEEINQAVERAIRTVAGPHRKVVARRLAHRAAAYLSYLVTVVPPRAQPLPAASPRSAGRPSRKPARPVLGRRALGRPVPSRSAPGRPVRDQRLPERPVRVRRQPGRPVPECCRRG